MSLVEALLDMNRAQEANAVERQIIVANPGNPRALLANGRILIAQGKPREAAAALEKAVQGDPQSAIGYYFLGVAQRALRMPDLARASFNRALALAPGMAEAQAQLASLNAAAGNTEEALSVASSALKTHPGMPVAQLAEAKALAAKGQQQQADSVLEDILNHDPTSLPALAQLLNLRLVQGRTAEVVHRLAGLTQQNPTNAGLEFLLALGYFDLKDLQESESALQRAMALDPSTPEAYSLLGNIHTARGAIGAAKQDFRKAIDANPHHLSNYLALERLYEREGNWAEAKKLCEKAHQVDPESALAAGSLAVLYLDHGGDVNVALSLAENVKQKMPHSALAGDTLGWAYYRLGSFDSAVAELERSVRGAPANAMFEYHLGMAYAASRQPGAARRTLEKSLHDDPRSPFVASINQTLATLPAGPK